MKKIIAVVMLVFPLIMNSQTIGEFISVEPNSQDQLFHIPSTHVFQVLIQSGNPLTEGGTMPINSDFSGYVPINNSSENGYLSINSEFVPGGVTILDINFNPTSALWNVSSSQSVDFGALGTILTPGTVANCSGAVTPWNTIVTCEENEIGVDANLDGYIDYGWNIEIDPVTKTVINQDGQGGPDKLWAMGRMKHENIVVASDNITVYQGEDNSANGFLYKYVCDEAQKLATGTLYALRLTDSVSGEWVKIPNTTADERDNTIQLSVDSGATAFNRIEDVDISADGKIYFASTGQSKVFRFDDDGMTISNFEVFVDGLTYSIDHGTGIKDHLFTGCDNLVFDDEGNLWITQDAATKNIWVVGPSHTSLNPDIRVFANTPQGSEPTGLTFSPDYRFLFMSIQHPAAGNQETNLDATGSSYSFNRDATIVISRAENLGPLAGKESELVANPSFGIKQTSTNPIKDEISYSINSSKSQTILVELTDIMGRVISIEKKRIQKGETQEIMDMSVLAPGNYFLVAKSESNSAVLSILK